MFKELEKYKNGSFGFILGDRPSKVCNAPHGHGGVYLVYSIIDKERTLDYIGLSGKMQPDGKLKLRKGGPYDRIVNGKRTHSWIQRIKKYKLDALEIHWYITFDDNMKDIPAFVEGVLIQKHFDKYGRLPIWNLEF